MSSENIIIAVWLVERKKDDWVSTRDLDEKTPAFWTSGEKKKAQLLADMNVFVSLTWSPCWIEPKPAALAALQQTLTPERQSFGANDA